ncbi:DNA polymerase delta subunit 4 isoform X2 [Hippopotamus amphibius kiboko]|uniref:DNA polymerase delta subunit 4 isoform X2 n=1 Tax=Hippopotamus amphibius kiboko TaxID=575201 RepID=UPI00259937EB|nr:DNA polymerase delta subunit 4 isoform X2 [Hippopotamus amphibius kiboko]
MFVGVGERRHSLELSDFLSVCLGHPSVHRWPQACSPAPALSHSLSLSSCLSRARWPVSPSRQSPPSPPAWVAAMGRKRLLTDSYPVVKRREGSAGHSKGELAPELGEEPESQPLSVDEAELELLRQFDLAWQYGPCTGITRLQRWHRAEQMGLKPPPEVHQVLQTHPGDPRFQCSLWHLYPL